MMTEKKMALQRVIHEVIRSRRTPQSDFVQHTSLSRWNIPYSWKLIVFQDQSSSSKHTLEYNHWIYGNHFLGNLFGRLHDILKSIYACHPFHFDFIVNRLISFSISEFYSFVKSKTLEKSTSVTLFLLECRLKWKSYRLNLICMSSGVRIRTMVEDMRYENSVLFHPRWLCRIIFMKQSSLCGFTVQSLASNFYVSSLCEHVFGKLFRLLLAFYSIIRCCSGQHYHFNFCLNTSDCPLISFMLLNKMQ